MKDNDEFKTGLKHILLKRLTCYLSTRHGTYKLHHSHICNARHNYVKKYCSLDIFIYILSTASRSQSLFIASNKFNVAIISYCGGEGDVVEHWIEHATPGQEVVASIPALAPYWLGQCQYNVAG